MSWGKGKWGAGAPWGTGVDLPPPVLHAIYPTILDERGGTVLAIFGENFADPVTVQVMKLGVVLEPGYIFDPEFDLEANRVYAGMPAMPTGLYDLRVLVGGVESNLLEGVLDYRKFAEEIKVERARSGFSPVWKTGPRLLTGGGTPL